MTAGATTTAASTSSTQSHCNRRQAILMAEPAMKTETQGQKPQSQNKPNSRSKPWFRWSQPNNKPWEQTQITIEATWQHYPAARATTRFQYRSIQSHHDDGTHQSWQSSITWLPRVTMVAAHSHDRSTSSWSRAMAAATTRRNSSQQESHSSMIIQNQNSSNAPHDPPERAMAAQPTEPAPPSKKPWQ